MLDGGGGKPGSREAGYTLLELRVRACVCVVGLSLSSVRGSRCAVAFGDPDGDDDEGMQKEEEDGPADPNLAHRAPNPRLEEERGSEARKKWFFALSLGVLSPPSSEREREKGDEEGGTAARARRWMEAGEERGCFRNSQGKH